jgi:hypothetical protein
MAKGKKPAKKAPTRRSPRREQATLLARARRLFIAYNGFHFHMLRDGVIDEYRQANVPPETEAEWLERITQRKLRELSKDDNWSVIYFLKAQGDYRHLARVLEADPRGNLTRQCIFLEVLLEYARAAGKAGIDPTLVKQAVSKVITDAERLLRKARSKDSVRRIQDLLAEARQNPRPE